LIAVLWPYGLCAQLTLEACQQKAKANYPLIKQYDLIEKSKEFSLSNAGKAYLPQVSVTAIAGYIIQGLPDLAPPGLGEEQDKFQLIGLAQLRQNIWDGGATKTQRKIEESAAEADKAALDVAFHALGERVNQVYFSILLLDEQSGLLKILRDNLDRNLKAVLASHQNGLAYSADVDEVQVERLKVDQREAEVNFARKGFAAMLALLTGDPSAESQSLERPSEPGDVAQLSVQRPELRMYNYQRAHVQAQSGLSKVSYMPKVGLLGIGVLIEPGMAFGTETINSLALAGLSVSWSAGGLYQKSNNAELTKLRLERIRQQEETFRFNTSLQLNQQDSEVQKQKAIVAKDREIVALRQSIRQAYEVKYQNGVSTMNDLLRTTNAESESRQNMALHQVQLLMSLYAYKTTSGN
jgi:outer membrane protein TolC